MACFQITDTTEQEAKVPFMASQPSTPDLRWVLGHLWNVASHLHNPGLSYHPLRLDHLIKHGCVLLSL